MGGEGTLDLKKQLPKSGKHGVATDDLFNTITPDLSAMQNPNDVHFSFAGYDFPG